MENDLLPDVDYEVYLYFGPGASVEIDHSRLLSPDRESILIFDDDDGLPLTGVSMVAASLDEFGGFLRFAAEADAQLAGSLLNRAPAEDPTHVRVGWRTVEVVRGDSEWAAELRRQFGTVEIARRELGETPARTLTIEFDGAAVTSAPPATPAPVFNGEAATAPPAPPATLTPAVDGEAVTAAVATPTPGPAEPGSMALLRDRNPQAWNMLTNLPVSEDDPPVAAGFMATGGDLIKTVAEDAGISVPGLDTAFGMVRVNNVAFGVYGGVPSRIPDRIGAELLNELDTGVVLVGGTGFTGIAVAFLVRSIAGKIGMDTIDLGNTNARYLELEQGHLVLKNKGSLVYVTVAGSRDKAEALMLRALAE